jgi:hypothetical protein
MCALEQYGTTMRCGNERRIKRLARSNRRGRKCSGRRSKGDTQNHQAKPNPVAAVTEDDEEEWRRMGITRSDRDKRREAHEKVHDATPFAPRLKRQAPALCRKRHALKLYAVERHAPGATPEVSHRRCHAGTT